MHTVGRVFLALAFFCAPLSVSWAAGFSVVVVERGPATDMPTQEASIAWESGILAALFEAGHIVSNTPIRRGDMGDAVDTAREGGAQYLLVAELEYPSPSTSPVVSRISPRSAAVKIFSVDPVRLLFEDNRVLSGRSAVAAEDERIAEEIARAAIARMKDR